MKRQELDRLTLLGEQDLYLFNEGSHLRLWEHLGAHPLPEGGTVFGVWAPSAERVSVIGDFNGWDREADPLTPPRSALVSRSRSRPGCGRARTTTARSVGVRRK